MYSVYRTLSWPWHIHLYILFLLGHLVLGNCVIFVFTTVFWPAVRTSKKGLFRLNTQLTFQSFSLYLKNWESKVVLTLPILYSILTKSINSQNFWIRYMAWMFGTPVGQHLGGRLAMRLVATISDMILFSLTQLKT